MKASRQHGHSDPTVKLFLKGFSTVEGKPKDPSDIIKYLDHRGNPNSPNAAFHDFDETYAQGAPKRTHKHYIRALNKFNQHAHNDVAPVTSGLNHHDHVRFVHGTNSVINNPKQSLEKFNDIYPGEYTRDTHSKIRNLLRYGEQHTSPSHGRNFKPTDKAFDPLTGQAHHPIVPVDRVQDHPHVVQMLGRARRTSQGVNSNGAHQELLRHPHAHPSLSKIQLDKFVPGEIFIQIYNL